MTDTVTTLPTPAQLDELSTRLYDEGALGSFWDGPAVYCAGIAARMDKWAEQASSDACVYDAAEFLAAWGMPITNERAQSLVNTGEWMMHKDFFEALSKAAEDWEDDADREPRE